MIRPLTESDAPRLDLMFQRAFGTPESFGSGILRQLRVQPDGCWVVEVEGNPAGMVSTVRYGEIAYIGYMGIEPRLQGMGLGAELLRTALDDLERNDGRTLLLDATPAGEPLYRRFGFEDAGSSFDLRGVPVAQGLPGLEQSCGIVELDREIFGADRRVVLDALTSEPDNLVFATPEGFLVAQEKVIGPWVARDSATAASLLSAAVTASPGRPRRIMVPAENQAALRIAEACGLTVLREVRHMRRGAPAPWDLTKIYGHASYALG